MKRRLIGLLLIIGSIGAGQETLASGQCDISAGQKMLHKAEAPWTMRIQLNPKDVPLNKPFDAVVTVCSQTGKFPSRLTIDATMPAHKHGMNYKPKTSKLDNRTFKAENLLFHMPGSWRLEVTAYTNENAYRFSQVVNLR